MFLHLLDRAQRRELCRAALFLVAADEVVDLREEEALAHLRVALGSLDPDDLPRPPRDLDDLLEGLDEVFDTPERRRVLVLELAILVLADDEVDERELEVLAAVCRRLDVSRETFGRLRELARRVLALRADGMELLGEGP
ncbi:MAG: TerB family tellurite resistance protein [Planctomycetes bacterium]|nr:TerB family tellurite resistance protein [Planctomycetota bacterium]